MDEDDITLSTGRVFRIGGAGRGVLGIGADLDVYEGYDHPSDLWEGYYANWMSPDDPDWDPERAPLTIAEKIEVCDAMIGRWDRLRAQLTTQKK